jgi:hypothetical protein
MLLTINRHYRQPGKNSRMHMNDQGQLIEGCFIEIYQVFEEKSLILF